MTKADSNIVEWGKAGTVGFYTMIPAFMWLVYAMINNLPAIMAIITYIIIAIYSASILALGKQVGEKRL